MKRRILPPEEWSRLETGMPQIAPILNPDDVRVVVIESDGEIAAAVTLYRALHWEGTWVSAKHKNAGIVRALLKSATEAGLELGHAWTYVSCDNPDIAALIERLEGVKIPTEHYVMPLPELRNGIECSNGSGTDRSQSTLVEG